MAVFKGSAVAIVTPMKENGDINYDKLAELIDEQIEAAQTPSSSAALRESLLP